MRRRVILTNRHCTTPLSAPEILEPIAERFVFPTVWRISSSKCALINTHLTGLGNGLKNTGHQPPLTPPTMSKSATIKSP